MCCSSSRPTAPPTGKTAVAAACAVTRPKPSPCPRSAAGSPVAGPAPCRRLPPPAHRPSCANAAAGYARGLCGCRRCDGRPARRDARLLCHVSVEDRNTSPHMESVLCTTLHPWVRCSRSPALPSAGSPHLALHLPQDPPACCTAAWSGKVAARHRHLLSPHVRRRTVRLPSPPASSAFPGIHAALCTVSGHTMRCTSPPGNCTCRLYVCSSLPNLISSPNFPSLSLLPVPLLLKTGHAPLLKPDSRRLSMLCPPSVSAPRRLYRSRPSA